MRTHKYRIWDGLYKEMYYQDEDAVPYEDHKGGLVFYFEGLKATKERSPGVTKLLEWTGLKDSKGVDIYEGDILEDWHAVVGPKLEIPMRAAVRWEKYGWTTATKGQEQLVYAGRPPFFNWEECEIIGNRFQNPELL